MENYTLTFITMKAKVEIKPKDLVEYIGFLMFAIFVFYIAVTPHR
jgi:hypothetical protein